MRLQQNRKSLIDQIRSIIPFNREVAAVAHRDEYAPENASVDTVAAPVLNSEMDVTKAALNGAEKTPAYSSINLLARTYSLNSDKTLGGFVREIYYRLENNVRLFKSYPLRMSLSLLTNAAMLISIPIIAATPLALLGVGSVVLYQYFTGSIIYFNKSMRMYSELTFRADKSNGDRFVHKGTLSKEVAACFNDVPEKFQKDETGLTIRDGAVRFSYAVSPENAREFNHYMHSVLAREEKKIENMFPSSPEYKAQKKLLGELESLRYMADRRATLHLAGRRQRGLANRWFFDLPKGLNAYQLPESLQNNPGVYIHQVKGKSVLQVNYALKRTDLEVLVNSLKENMNVSGISAAQRDAFVEKLRIGYKVVETNFNADIHGESFLDLDPAKRMNMVVEASTFTSLPPFIAHNMLYSSAAQLDTTNLRMVFNLMNNSTNSYDVQTQGLGAMARVIEARMNAILSETGKFEKELVSKKDKGADVRSHNFYELALQLADPYGRQITPNIVLAETIQQAFPADGQERAMLLNALYDLNLYNNVDGEKYIYYKGKKLYIEETGVHGKDEISLRQALKGIILESRSNQHYRGREVSEAQIDNFIDLLVYNRAMQEQSEVFASIIAKFHATGKMDAKAIDDLTVLIHNRYSVKSMEHARAIVSQIILKQKAVADKTKSYIQDTSQNKDLDKVNNFDEDGLETTEFINLMSYAKTLTIAHKGNSKAYISEVLESTPEKVNIQKFESELGENIAQWMSGAAKSSIGGFEEGLRWDIEYYVRKDYAARMQTENKDIEIRTVQSTVKRYDEEVSATFALTPEIVALIQKKYKSIACEYDAEKKTARLKFKANDAGFKKLINSKLVVTGDKKVRDAMVDFATKNMQYVSTFNEPKEVQLMTTVVALTDKATAIFKKHRYSLHEMHEKMQARQAQDQYFASLSLFDQYKILVDENIALIREELRAAFKAENYAHEELADSIVDLMIEGEALQQATARGLICQTNKVLENAKRMNGVTIFASGSDMATVATNSRANVVAVREDIHKKYSDTNEQKAVLTLLKGVLAPFGSKKAAGGPNYWQLTFREASTGLLSALKKAAEHEKGKKYENSEHWNLSVAGLINGTQTRDERDAYLGGGELKANYGDRTLTLDSIENIYKTLLAGKDKEIALLKKMSLAELQVVLGDVIALLEAEAVYKSDLELLLEKDCGIGRDAAISAVALIAEKTLEGKAADYKVDIAPSKFLEQYQSTQNGANNQKIAGKDAAGKATEITAYALFGKIMHKYIETRSKKPSVVLSESEREPETMFRNFRSSPEDDQNGKPGIFNMSYTGVTVFENMQKTMKAVMNWHRQWDGDYTLTQIWKKFKDEQLRDTISIPMPKLYHRGVAYDFWDLLDVVFAEMDKNFDKADYAHILAADPAAEALDKKRNYNKTLDAVFQKAMTGLIANPELKDLHDTLVRVASAGRTMSEKVDASFQANVDKDNFLYKTYMSMIMNVFKPKEDGSIVNETTVLVQAQQDLYFSLFNKLQQAAMIDMHDFRTTEAYVLGQQGREQDQGCFNVRNRKYDTYFHLTRSALEISTPTNTNPPGFLPRFVTAAIAFAPAAGVIFGAFQLMMVLGASALMPMIVMPIVGYIMLFKVAPAIQAWGRKVWRKRIEESKSFFKPAMLRRTLDLSKKYSSVEDYRAKTEAMKSFLFALQSYSMQGAALAESDFDVQVEVQFPRWNLAHLELEATEIIDKAFIEEFIHENKLAHEVYEDIPEHYEEAKNNNRYPMSALFNLRFGSIMATYALAGISIFGFAGTLLTGLFGGIPAIVVFGLLSVINYAVIKRTILRHHKNIGISRRNERVAEDRFGAINAILVPKILNVAVSLAKMPFITSEPVFRAMRRYFPDLYLRNIEREAYALNKDLVKNMFWNNASNTTEWLRKKMPAISLATNIAYPIFVAGATILNALMFGATVLSNLLFLPISFSLIAFAVLGHLNLYRRVKLFINGGVVGISSKLEYDLFKKQLAEHETQELKAA